MVTDITVTFSGLVTLPTDPTAAFKLTRLGPGSPTGDVPLAVDLSGSTPTQTVAKLTFSGATFTENGSLTDGNYSFTVLGGQIIGANGFALDGDGNGTAGGNNVSEQYRLFGDADGNRTVDALDLLAMGSSYGLHAGAPGYLAYFDWDNNGVIDALDLLQMRNRYGTVLNP
jgi:hypothetical protein